MRRLFLSRKIETPRPRPGRAAGAGGPAAAEAGGGGGGGADGGECTTAVGVGHSLAWTATVGDQPTQASSELSAYGRPEVLGLAPVTLRFGILEQLVLLGHAPGMSLPIVVCCLMPIW